MFRSNLIKTGVALTVVLTAAVSHAVTTQNFEGGGTNFTSAGNNGGALPSVQAGGPTGNFGQLMPDGVGSLVNSVAFDQTDLGAAVSLTFDARLPVEGTHTGCCGERADGFGVAFLNTQVHGTTGAAPTGFAWERPQIAGAFAVGFDIFQGGNAAAPDVFTLNVNGQEVASNATLLNGGQLTDGNFGQYNVTFTPTNNGTAVSLTITPDIHGAPGAPVTIFNNVNIEGMSPGGRLAAGGRTGGAFTSVDFDNIVAQYANVQRSTTADFDSPGTGYNANQNGTAPGATVVSGGPNGNFLRLINDGVNSQQNTVAFNATEAGLSNNGHVFAEFDFRAFSNTGAPADGFSMLLIPTDTFGTVGTGQAVVGGQAEEPNFPGTIALGFDFHPAGSVNDVSLHFGSEIVNITLDNNVLDLDNGLFNHAVLELVESGGQVLASLTLTPDSLGTPGAEQTIFSNVALGGLTELYDFRVQFAGRTGGLNMTVDLDNINVYTIPEPATGLLALLGLAGLSRRRRAAVAV